MADLATNNEQYTLHPDYDDYIVLRCRRVYVRTLAFCLGLIATIWVCRILQFEETILGNDVDKSYVNNGWNWISATEEVVLHGNGWLSILATIGSFYFMWHCWQQFTVYLCASRPGAAPDKYKGKPPLRVLAAIHDPPGDIFTLIGIGSTFLGLALGLVTLSTEVIYHVVNGLSDDPKVPDLGLTIISAVIVFGSSLAVGLVASLHGIILAVCARRLAAEFSVEVSPHPSAVPPPPVNALEKPEAS